MRIALLMALFSFITTYPLLRIVHQERKEKQKIVQVLSFHSLLNIVHILVKGNATILYKGEESLQKTYHIHSTKGPQIEVICTENPTIHESVYELRYKNQVLVVWTYHNINNTISSPFVCVRTKKKHGKEFFNLFSKKRRKHPTEEIKFLELAIIVITDIIRKQQSTMEIQNKSQICREKKTLNQAKNKKNNEQMHSKLYTSMKEAFLTQASYSIASEEMEDKHQWERLNIRGNRLIKAYETLNLESQRNEESNVLVGLQQLIYRMKNVQRDIDKNKQTAFRRELRIIQELERDK